MQNIYSLPPREQAERFRALFKYLDQQYMRLVQIYQIAVPPWTVQAVIDQFNKTARARGFEIVRSALLDTCILTITKLLVDGDDTNPSLLTMVRPFLSGNRERRAELLQILEHDYSDWARRISREERESEPALVIKMFEEQGEKDAEALRKEFWDRADSIAKDWPKLKQASETFVPVRNKWIAHFEVEYDETKEYKPVDLPSLKDVYLTIERVVPIIIESVSHLAGLFKNLSISPEQFAALAKRDAYAFWGISDDDAPQLQAIVFPELTTRDTETYLRKLHNEALTLLMGEKKRGALNPASDEHRKSMLAWSDRIMWFNEQVSQVKKAFLIHF